MLSGLTQKIKNKVCYNTYLTSVLAAAIEPGAFAGEAGDTERMTGGYFYRSCWKFFRILTLEFLSQNTNMRMLFRNVCTYTYIYTKSRIRWFGGRGGLASLDRLAKYVLLHKII